MPADLADVLVVTVRKSFWASPEAEAFPNRLYARVFRGHSTNFVNSFVVFVRALVAVALRRPRVVVLGSVERTVPWFLRARRYGLLGGAKVVVTNQLHLSDEQLEQVDRDIVYSRAWIARQPYTVRQRAVFMPLPADGDFEAAGRAARPGGYVFTGGGAGRDFASVVDALRGTDVWLEVVTFAPDELGPSEALPRNVTVSGPMPVQSFLERLAGARVAVVPLRERDSDFGQTTLVQALSLGRAVVATRAPATVDYVEDGIEGFLVEAGDVAGYRAAILRLLEDDELRAACERRALERAGLSTYDEFGRRLSALCADLLAEDAKCRNAR